MATPKNYTQQEILDRLKTESGIKYHPASTYGGEVVDMRDAGLIATHQDPEGFLWITRPDAEAESAV